MALVKSGFQLIGIEGGREQVPDTVEVKNINGVTAAKTNQLLAGEAQPYYVSAETFSGYAKPYVTAYLVTDGMKFKVPLIGDDAPTVGALAAVGSDGMTVELDSDGIFVIEDTLDNQESGDEVIVRYVSPLEDNGGSDGGSEV